MLEKWKQELQNHTLSKIMLCCCFSLSDINCGLAGKSPSHLLEVQLENHFHSEREGETQILNVWIGIQEPSLARLNDISFQLSRVFRSHPKVPGALTNKAGKVPGSSQSLGVSTSKQPALAMCHKTQATREAEIQKPELWASDHLWTWTSERALGKAGRTHKIKCISHQNFIMVITQLHFQECF